MNTVKIVSGKILFDEFDSTNLNDCWTLIPNDPTRYSLTERSGFLKIFHGDPDIMMIMDEPDQYVLDLRNEYVPLNDSCRAGIVVYKDLDNSLEVLEWMDSTKDASYVYEFIRIIKNNNIYTAYGMNTEGGTWDLIGSGEFQSAGKVGLIVRGPSIEGSPDFVVDYVRLYRSQDIQYLNVPVGYTVRLNDANHNLLSVKKVVSPYNGVRFTVDKIPPFQGYFMVYNENGDLIHTSNIFDLCGGDIYYYGAVLEVSLNGNDLTNTEECFLGYFIQNEIDFTLELFNPHDTSFLNVTLMAGQYQTNDGYKCVTFSTMPDSGFANSVSIAEITAGSKITIYGKISRNDTVTPSDIDPFKFLIKLIYS